MTAATNSEREQKQSKDQQSLKGALANVLGKSGQKTEDRRREAPRPITVEPPQEGKKPFEVPEDALRKVLKGES